MKINNIKVTKEVVIRTEYVAEDGVVFYNEEECKKYEESALFAVSKLLKRLTEEDCPKSNINDDLPCDDTVEIFDVQTEKDLENLKKYLYLKARKNGASENYVEECFTSKDGKRNKYVFENVTIGHEVMIFWNYDKDWFWVYNDGSIDGYCEFFRDRITKLITPKDEVTETK